MAKRCPHCDLFNPDTVLSCDCGYEFASGQLGAPDTAQICRSAVSPRSRVLLAFLIAPLVASSAWYVLMLGALAIANGRLRWTTDVLAMAIGAVILGVPVAAAITLVPALPLYLLVRSTGNVSLWTAAVSGGTIGLSVAWLFWMLAHEWTVLSPVRGVLIGVATAVAWWYTARQNTSARPLP